MSQRTIIEINHDYLQEVGAALTELVKMLPYASENEVREHLSMSSGIRFLARRHHAYDMKVLIAKSPDTPLPYVQPRLCPYCTSDNEAIRSTYYDQTCEGCVKRMG